MAYDGITNSARVEGLTDRKLYAKVCDNVLSSKTYMSRLMGMGRVFEGKTEDFTVKVVDSGQGEFFTGLETLNTAAVDTKITLSFGQTAFTQPFVSIMTESFANVGEKGVINIDEEAYEEAVGDAAFKLGGALYGLGIGNQPLGLEAVVDDATNVATIGGQSRSTYTQLKATRTDFGGTLSLAKLATLEDTVSASGIDTETPNLNLTTKTIWSLYEQLLQPTVRQEYNASGYPVMSLRGDASIQKASDIKGAIGFTVLGYRGKPVLKDDGCTSGVWYMLNERYLHWYGRTEVPEIYRDYIEKLDLGEMKTLEGVAAHLLPPTTYGWFRQKRMMLPNQAGMVGRIYVIGQVMSNQFRRHGKGVSISGI